MRVLLGISAGIAAFKIPILIRYFIKAGAEVKCIMTPASSDFISPLVLSTLSKNPVGMEFWNKETGEWNNHVAYGEWADILVIAPATANTLQKMAYGSCDNLLLACYLSMRKKTIVVPAMDLDMYKHPSVERNLQQIKEDGVTVIPPTNGELASGLVGEGRMEEPEEIFNFVMSHMGYTDDFSSKKVLITAGPTFEAIDPVRFIGNHSSGKMGFALAEALSKRGAHVLLVSGPTHLQTQAENIEIIKVTTALEMFEMVRKNWEFMDIGIFAAAVSDYRPEEIATQKIKKTQERLKIDLIPNPDILMWAGENNSNEKYIVGFALETSNEKENALVKLKNKKASCIVLNSLQEKGAGFAGDSNKVTIFGKEGDVVEIPLNSKENVSHSILDFVLKHIK